MPKTIIQIWLDGLPLRIIFKHCVYMIRLPLKQRGLPMMRKLISQRKLKNSLVGLLVS